jgi:hypothetical protein
MDLGSSYGPSSELNQSARPSLSTTQEPNVGDVSAGGGVELGGGNMSDDDHDGPDDDEDGERPSIFVQQNSMMGEKVADVDRSTRASEGVRRSERVAAAEGGRRSERPKKRIIDMWAMLDPHEEVGATKAFKKGACKKEKKKKKKKKER